MSTTTSEQRHWFMGAAACIALAAVVVGVAVAWSLGWLAETEWLRAIWKVSIVVFGVDAMFFSVWTIKILRTPSTARFPMWPLVPCNAAATTLTFALIFMLYGLPIVGKGPFSVPLSLQYYTIGIPIFSLLVLALTGAWLCKLHTYVSIGFGFKLPLFWTMLVTGSVIVVLALVTRYLSIVSNMIG